MADYAQYQPSILPAWLQGINGLNYAGVLGSLKDIISNGVRAAAIVGMPTPTADAGALQAIGYERQLPRGAFETDQQYAGRLQQAWDAWTRAGTALGILLQLEVIYPGIPIVIVQQADRAFMLDPNTLLDPYSRLIIITLPGGGWTFDDNGGLPPDQGFWSRFCVIFPGPLPTYWNDVESPPTPSTSPSLNEINTIIGIVNQWKPAKATWVSLIAVTGGRVWGLPAAQEWGDSGAVYGGSTVVWQTTPY